MDTKESRWIKPKELEDIEKSMAQQNASSTDSPNMYVDLLLASILRENVFEGMDLRQRP